MHWSARGSEDGLSSAKVLRKKQVGLLYVVEELRGGPGTVEMIFTDNWHFETANTIIVSTIP